MSDWLLNLPVLWMGALILGAIYVCTAGLHLLITALAVGERARAFKGISPGMLPPLAVLFALLVRCLAPLPASTQEERCVLTSKCLASYSHSSPLAIWCACWRGGRCSSVAVRCRPSAHWSLFWSPER